MKAHLAPLFFLPLLFVILLCSACEQPAEMTLESTAVSEGDTVPTEYTCDGEDTSPDLSWSDIPEGTESFALIMDDPDAPSGTFTHWLVFDIPSSTTNLQENFPEKLTINAKEGLNDFSESGYGGPCPPEGQNHRYIFTLYALDLETLGLAEGASRAEIEAAMLGHVIGRATLTAMYGR